MLKKSLTLPFCKVCTGFPMHYYLSDLKLFFFYKKWPVFGNLDCELAFDWSFEKLYLTYLSVNSTWPMCQLYLTWPMYQLYLTWPMYQLYLTWPCVNSPDPSKDPTKSLICVARMKTENRANRNKGKKLLAGQFRSFFSIFPFILN